MVDFLERRAFSRVTAVMLVYAGVAAILVVFFAGAVPLVLGELEAFANAVPKYSMGITMRLNEMQRLYSKVILPAGLRQVMDENIVRLENTILSYVRGTASFALALFSHMLAIIIAPILSFLHVA
jgi:predicted PurR-regulated permease PerM